MLKFWYTKDYIKDTHHLHHLPAPIKKSVGGETAILPSSTPPLLLTGPESLSDSEIRRKHSSGPSRCSPSSPLNWVNSPSRQPYSYADAISEQSQLLQIVNSPSLSSLSLLNMEAGMEVLESRRVTDGRLITSGEKSEPQKAMVFDGVVVVDATKELQLAALLFALEFHVSPGDNLCLLGILHQVLNPMGYKQKAGSTLFNGTSCTVIQGEIAKKKEEFQNCVNDPELQKLFDLKQVVLDVRVVAGPDRKVVTATHAAQLRAKWVILDKNLKKDQRYLIENLNCKIMLMTGKKLGKCIKLPVGDENNGRHYSVQGQYQEELSIDTEPSAAPSRQIRDLSPRGISDTAPKRLSKAFNPIRESSCASDSSTSPEQHNKTAIVYNRLLFTMPESDSSPLHHREGELEAEPEEDQSRPTLEPLDHQREFEMMREEMKEVSEDEDVETLPEHDIASLLSSTEMVLSAGSPPPNSDIASLLSSTEMVLSAGSPPANSLAYKIPGRPMSTGDLQSLMTAADKLQSLMPKHSAATVFRPAPRSASDRAGDELMNILRAPKSPPDVISKTPKSVRTLQRSLREDDREPQTPPMHMDNGLIGRQSKFGNQNEENRTLDNSARKKNPRPAAPLCSKCNHPGPVFGKDAIQFTYAQLEQATKNFDQQNYLAEGGYGFVYKGELEGGQQIAVKQYKAASSQGDDEFYSEVEVLKHAQHRNLVILIGYCKEQENRLLVYEFVCNKSLDVHLSAKNPNVLEWKSRWKIAVGAARGLRYLHEECRVGCIVHRDMRPNNILLTHDFVPMVGDFGLARSQTSGDNPEETRVIGTLGYLAPEYAESGSITEKADVYSFGVVLLELITGRKAIDATRVRGETCLTEWARPLIIQGGKTSLEIVDSIVDPRLKSEYDIDQVNKMVDAAGRCISKDPSQRPRISEVLRILEQDTNSGLLSRVSSATELSDISRSNTLTHRESRSRVPSAHKTPISIPRQASLDSVHAAKGAAKVTGDLSSKDCPSSLSAIRVAKPSKELLASERAPSPHPPLKSSANSPGRKPSLQSPRSKSKSKTNKLSYSQMV